jgi:hypothetical protein
LTVDVAMSRIEVLARLQARKNGQFENWAGIQRNQSSILIRTRSYATGSGQKARSETMPRCAETWE